MEFTLKDGCYLKRLEEPYIYDTATDELYLLDDESFTRIQALCAGSSDPEAAGLLKEAGLLQPGGRAGPVYFEGHSASPSLRYLEVQITGRCDKMCRHCYLSAPEERDMDPQVFSAILEELTGMQGLKAMVSGGEPACHPRFGEMIRKLPDHPLRAVLITHGEWIGEEEARWVSSFFHQVQVSLDGLESGHDALRGKGSYDRAMKGIRMLLKAGVPVSVGTMAHEANLDQFEAMSGLIKGLGVQEWDIDVPCPAGRYRVDELEPGIYRSMSEKLRFGYGGGFHGGSAGLACGSHLMTVAPDGRAAKCGFYLGDPVGNVREGLGKIWGMHRHVPLARLQCECDQVEECAGGCRFRAEVLGGSDLAPDIVQCYARGVK